MHVKSAMAVMGAAALVLSAAGTAPAFAAGKPNAKPRTAASAASVVRAVKCHVYTDKKRGYKYTVRKAAKTSAGVIVVYHGKKLLGWKTGARCPQVTGGTYRCAVGEPRDNQWLVVNYKGRKGYVADRCTGGIGA